MCAEQSQSTKTVRHLSGFPSTENLAPKFLRRLLKLHCLLHCSASGATRTVVCTIAIVFVLNVSATSNDFVFAFCSVTFLCTVPFQKHQKAQRYCSTVPSHPKMGVSRCLELRRAGASWRGYLRVSCRMTLPYPDYIIPSFIAFSALVTILTVLLSSVNDVVCACASSTIVFIIIVTTTNLDTNLRFHNIRLIT